MELIRELNEQRGNLVEQARAFIHKGDDSPVTAEDMASFDAAMADADKLGERVRAEERLIASEFELDENRRLKAGLENKVPDQVAEEEKFEAEAFDLFLKGGIHNPRATDKHREFMSRRFDPDFQAAQSVGTPGAGGYTVPQEFYRQLNEAMKAYGGMRDVATIMRTASGATMLLPTVNDTGNTGAILAENTQVSTQDVAFLQQSIGSFMYTSKLVLVSLQLLQDSAFNLNAFLAKALGTRIARITNTHFTTGAGTTLPFGIVVGAALGKTGASGQTTTVIYDDFVDLEHSVDPEHRRAPGVGWMFADTTLAAAKKLLDANDLPIWQPGLAYGAPDRILNYPYTINQDMAAMAASAKSIIFGDLSQYLIREVLGIQMMRLSERYADYLQVGFLAYARYDGLLQNAGSNPVKYYINAAS